VIVVNLLIGLTVCDINDLKKEGSIFLASMQIHDIVDMKRKLDYPCIRFIFAICSASRPQQLMEKFTKKNTKDPKDQKVTPKKVCIRLDPSNQSNKKKSIKSIISKFWMRFWRTEPEKQLYFYDKTCYKTDKFPGELSQEIILSARETLRIYKIEKQDFKEKLAAIREDSNVQYNKIVNQRSLSTDVKDIEDNLAKLAKLVKDLKIKI